MVLSALEKWPLSCHPMDAMAGTHLSGFYNNLERVLIFIHHAHFFAEPSLLSTINYAVPL